MSSSRRRGWSRSSTDRRGSRSIGTAGQPSVQTPSPNGKTEEKILSFVMIPDKRQAIVVEAYLSVVRKVEDWAAEKSGDD